MKALTFCMKPAAVKRGLITSVLVGSFLLMVNQGPAIAAGQLPALWQVGLTYTVPFVVSIVSVCLAIPRTS